MTASLMNILQNATKQLQDGKIDIEAKYVSPSMHHKALRERAASYVSMQLEPKDQLTRQICEVARAGIQAWLNKYEKPGTATKAMAEFLLYFDDDFCGTSPSITRKVTAHNDAHSHG